MQENVAKNGWELTKVARIGRSRSLYGQKRVEGGVGQSREPKLSVSCLHIILPTRFWPRNDRELPFLAIAPQIKSCLMEMDITVDGGGRLLRTNTLLCRGMRKRLSFVLI